MAGVLLWIGSTPQTRSSKTSRYLAARFIEHLGDTETVSDLSRYISNIYSYAKPKRLRL
jgi:hypothetical protein